ncbi:MAG: O-antigen ligase family protein [Candidatus Magasanikbacteria bacterium]
MLIFALAIYWLLKKDERGWYIIAGEIILGGSGGYLRLDFVSLRTVLLMTSVTIFFIQKIVTEKITFFKQYQAEFIIILVLISAVGLAAIRGLYMGHSHSAIYSDFIPYLFLLYYFPLREMWLSDRFRELGKSAILAAIFGNVLMILFTQIGLSSGLIVLQDSYYHWYRDVALGKITDLGFNFYRLVLNEHLLLIPIAIYFIGDIIKNKITQINLSVVACLLFILANNLTRAYILALAIGTLFLYSKNKWKRWLAISCTIGVLFILIFVSTHILASRGKSLGLEIFGLRLQSIVSPQIENSSLSRLLLLPKIFEKIKLHPILGTGLGDTVTVFSPVFKTYITTTHFDWGYYEINAEMGLFGTLSWIGLVLFTLYYITKTKEGYNKNIFKAIIVAILIINITSPALFHVFGILLIIFILSPIGIINHHEIEKK